MQHKFTSKKHTFWGVPVSEEIVVLPVCKFCVADPADIVSAALISHMAHSAAECELLFIKQGNNIPRFAEKLCRPVFAEAIALAFGFNKEVNKLLVVVEAQIDVSLVLVSQVFKCSFVVHGNTSINNIYTGTWG